MTTAPLEKPSSSQPAGGSFPLPVDQLYQVVAANFPSTAAIVFDRDLRFMLVDGSALREVGLNKQTMEGKTIYECFSPEMLMEHEARFKSALQGQRTQLDTYFGNDLYTVTYAPLRDDSKQIFGGLCTYVDISTRKQAEENAQRRLREMELISEVSAAASASTDLESLLLTASELVKDRFHFYHAHVYLLNEEQTALVLAAGAGEAGRIMKRRGHRISASIERSLVARAARTRQSARVDDVLSEADFLPNPLLPETRSEIALPLVASGTLYGVLDIQDTVVHRFDNDDVRMLSVLANQIAVAVQNAQRFSQMNVFQLRNAIRAQVSTRLSQAANENEIVRAMHSLSEWYPGIAFIQLSYVHSDASGAPSEVTTEAVVDGMGNLVPVAGLPVSRFTVENVPLLHYAFKSPNQVLITEDIDEGGDDATEMLKAYLNAMGVKTLVTFPMQTGNTWTGMLTMMWSESRHFSADEHEVLQNVLPALASVVGSRRQYLATMEAERAAQQLNQNLQIVAEIATRVANILDLDEMLTTASDLIKTRFNRYHAQIYLLDQEGVTLQLAAGAGSVGKSMKARKHAIPVARENSLVARAARSRKGVIENDVSSAPDFLPNPLLSETQSELAIPLITSEKVIGVLDVQASELDAFTDADVSFNTTLASQLASAIQNVRDVDEIRRSREQISRIYDLSVDLVGTATHEGYLKDINDSWSRILGWTTEELKSKPFVAFVHPDDVQPTLDEYARQISQGRPSVSFDNRYMCKDGSFRWLSWNAVPVASEGLTYFVTRDVTDRVEYERAIERRARELETVAQVSAAITTIFDREVLLQEVAHLTKQAFNLYHAHVYLTSENGEHLELAAGAGMVGNAMKKRGHRIAVSHPHSLVARAARSRQVVIENDVSGASDFLPNPLLPDTRSEMALPLIIGDRVLGVLDVQSDEVHHFRDDDMKVLSTLTSQVAVAVENTNVVQRVLLTERAVENSTSGLSIRDMVRPGKPLIYVNPAFVQMMGSDAKNTLEESWSSISLEDNDPTLLEEINKAMSEGRQTAVVALVKRADGTKFYDEIRLSPIFNVHSEVTHYVAVHTDISERLEVERQREETLRAAEETSERLREVDRLKSQFLANMSHELRTPLNSIIGYSEILMDGDDGELSEEAIEDVETIHNSGRHLLALINDVLDLAKIEAGEMRLDRVPCNVIKIADDVLHAAEVLLNNKSIALKTESIGGAGEALADPIRVRQILMNLVSNAIKFTEKGSVTVRIERGTDDRLHISVVDTGMGIPEASQSLIFEQFRQVDGSSTRRAGGTGLGLTITRHLVHMHKGEISVESKVGVGSTFRFSLPLADTQPA